MRATARCLALLLFTTAPALAASEEPAYRVISSAGACELRDYAPYLVAETTATGDFGTAGDIGFGRLFAYITGANRPAEDIAMTAPVMQQARPDAPGAGEAIAMTVPVTDTRQDGVHTVAFVVPARYTLATVPQPTDPTVTIRAVPGGRVASVRFSGYGSEATYREQEAALRECVARLSLTPTGPARLARYDSPFVPADARRNEIQIPVQ